MAFWNRRKADAAKAANGHRIIVAPAGDHWVVQIAGHFENKTSALLIGRYIASALDLQLDWRGEDGRIQGADSSGDAPDDPTVKG